MKFSEGITVVTDPVTQEIIEAKDVANIAARKILLAATENFCAPNPTLGNC